jgi:polyprenyl P-hydroxybenzoate and phenylacrylic acid decarboxylases
MARYLVCMTGASGAVYGLRLLEMLASPEGPCPGAEIHFVASAWAERVVLEETGSTIERKLDAIGRDRITRHAPDDLASPLSSGSFSLSAAAVAPCSMGTAGAIAAGLSSNLVQRAAAVALKEGWPLVLVPRESPLSLPALRSLVALKEAGAVILPASPGFYMRPASVAELVDQVVSRILDRMGLEMPGARRWAEGAEE